jgi:hypothetical protein
MSNALIAKRLGGLLLATGLIAGCGSTESVVEVSSSADDRPEEGLPPPGPDPPPATDHALEFAPAPGLSSFVHWSEAAVIGTVTALSSATYRPTSRR